MLHTMAFSFTYFLQLIGEDYTNSVQAECRHVSQEVEEVRLLLLLLTRLRLKLNHQSGL
jgi:hypothetical protein